MYLICRRGNDSVVAARALRRHLAGEVERGEGTAQGGSQGGGRVEIFDVKGGLVGWAREVDDEFPVY